MARKSFYSISLEEDSVVNDVEVSEVETVHIENDYKETTEDITQDLEIVQESQEVVEELQEQVETNEEALDNNEVTDELVQASNESFMYALGRLHVPREHISRYRVSSESYSTPLERLKLSNEGIKEFLDTVIEKIKAFFKKIWEKIKQWTDKLLKFLGIRKKKIDKETKDTVKKVVSINAAEKVIEEIKKNVGKVNTKIGEIKQKLDELKKGNNEQKAKVDQIIKDAEDTLKKIGANDDFNVSDEVNKIIEDATKGKSVDLKEQTRKKVIKTMVDGGICSIFSVIKSLDKNVDRFILGKNTYDLLIHIPITGTEIINSLFGSIASTSTNPDKPFYSDNAKSLLKKLPSHNDKTVINIKFEKGSSKAVLTLLSIADNEITIEHTDIEVDSSEKTAWELAEKYIVNVPIEHFRKTANEIGGVDKRLKTRTIIGDVKKYLGIAINELESYKVKPGLKDHTKNMVKEFGKLQSLISDLLMADAKLLSFLDTAYFSVGSIMRSYEFYKFYSENDV